MKIEIWSDIACPWCYIGKRRFETALEGFAHIRRASSSTVW
ncbi:DsbA family protein, partial [Mycobacterium tuberculosis]|nr:DsbA family protein [Mycobacterium tuberculosis]